jgi:hypothetical protein
MKGSTIAVILIVAVFFIAVIASVNLNTGPALSVYKGRIQVNLIQLETIDGSAYVIADSQMRVIHGDLDYNDKVGVVSGGVVSGDMKEADQGSWYLTIDYGTNTTTWLDQAETAKDPYVRRVFGWDGDKDGFLEDTVQLYFGDLAPLTAGEDKKTVDVHLMSCPAIVSGITFESLTNASGISTTAYDYYTATGYMDGFSEGDMARLAKVTIAFSDSGNTTYPDSEYWKLVQLKLGGYTFTASQFGPYDLANTRYVLKFGDQVNSQEGRPFYKGRNVGDLWATYELKAYCKYPGATTTIRAHVSFYFYQPDGTLATAVTRTMDFTTY